MAELMVSIPLLLTAPHECSYLAEHSAQSLFVYPVFSMTNDIYEHLLSKGFRRSGDEVYAPHCSGCSACLSARIPVAQFQATRGQKRCLRKNEKTFAIIKPAEFEPAHYAMYLRYQHSRHGDGNMAHASAEEYIEFLSSHWCNTQFVEFHIANELACIAVIDVFDSAYSAVYTFFEPKFAEYSLGTYAVLWQIQQAQLQEKEFVYLGFYISACRKMNYKSHYHPLQLLQHNNWIQQE
jgi:arginine-tRNA-protein transferase